MPTSPPQQTSFHERVDTLLGLPPLPLSEQHTRQYRSKLRNVWMDLGRWFIPGRWFRYPLGSFINFALYGLPSVYFGWILTWQSDRSASIVLFISSLLVAIFILFFFLTTIQALPVIAWVQLRKPGLRKRIFFFALPFFLNIFFYDTWVQIEQITIWTTFIQLITSLLIALSAGIFFASLAHLRGLGPLTMRTFYLLLFATSLLSVLLVFGASLNFQLSVMGITFLEYFTTITVRNIVDFLSFVVGLAPIIFLGLWWLFANEERIRTYRETKAVLNRVVQFVRALNVDNRYFLFWKLLVFPFLFSITFYLLDYYWPGFRSFIRASEGLSNSINFYSRMFYVIGEAGTLALFAFLFGVTIRYIFSPAAVNSIRISSPILFSNQVVKAIFILCMLFTAWWFLHSIAIFQFQLEASIFEGLTDGNITLKEAFFYAFSLMTGSDLSDYQPVSMMVRAYSIPVVLTGIALLAIFLGVALSNQEEPQQAPGNTEPASAANEAAINRSKRSRRIWKIIKPRKHHRD